MRLDNISRFPSEKLKKMRGKNPFDRATWCNDQFFGLRFVMNDYTVSIALLCGLGGVG